MKSFLKNLSITQLSEEQKLSCEGQITIEECKRILETFQNNKSPGNDGIPIEFYKACWDLTCQPFINCVNESFVKEEMSNSQKQAVIANELARRLARRQRKVPREVWCMQKNSRSTYESVSVSVSVRCNNSPRF